MPRPGRPTTERAKNFKGTLRQLIRTMSHYKLPLAAAMLFAILSTIFNIARTHKLCQTFKCIIFALNRH